MMVREAKEPGGEMNRKLYITKAAIAIMALACTVVAAKPEDDDDSNGPKLCAGLPDFAALKAALVTATASDTSGLKNPMWATIVDRDGVVCAVAFTGASRSAQWAGSRVISAQKANTGNAFSLDSSSGSALYPNGLALSTANLYTPVQPGGSLFGLQESNPVDTGVAYKGPSSKYGTSSDPMVGEKIGGINVFGGGLGLYATGQKLVGGVGVSGDTSCRDHNVAWLVRHALGFDHMTTVGGVSGDPMRPDNIVLDFTANPDGFSPSLWGHPTCLNASGSSTLPIVVP
jgi:hypothetical protein